MRKLPMVVAGVMRRGGSSPFQIRFQGAWILLGDEEETFVLTSTAGRGAAVENAAGLGRTATAGRGGTAEIAAGAGRRFG